MSNSPPPIPSEQKTFHGATNLGRRDAKTALQSNEPGDGDVNLDQQGRQANTRQNVDAVQHKGDR
jgi:hypothetical protein